MGFFRKLGLMLAIPVTYYVARTGYSQYQLQRSTFTVDEISHEDAVFESSLYRDIWGKHKYESRDSFAVGITIPFASVPPNLWTEEAFGAEIFKLLWDQRLITQFNQEPWGRTPVQGDGRVNEAMAAQVVSSGTRDMSIAILNRPSRTNVLPQGYEHILAAFNKQEKIAQVMIKYAWHMKKETPPSWRKTLARWFQINGRRQWLVTVANQIQHQRLVAEGKAEL
ncbi:hypothetical protein F5Y18DRAFT_389529 [Xylariaceae sp. FL1019]|nr:hypothetical protein F5Y18DRAFT_389529 [Xylariaceae sp. FL1019]